MPASSGTRLRWMVLALGGIELLALIAFVGLMLTGSDPIGKSIGQGMAQLALLPMLACVVPALALGISNRRLGVALILLLAALPLAFVLWRLA